MVQTLSEEGATWEEAMESHAYLIPSHMIGGIMRYVLNGMEPGDFLGRLLANDFMGAAGHADQINLTALGRWARFIYNAVPRGCWGDEERVMQWMASGGTEGMARLQALAGAEEPVA